MTCFAISEYADQGVKGEPRTKIVVIVISTAALLAVVIAAGYLVHKRRRNIVGIILLHFPSQIFVDDLMQENQTLINIKFTTVD